MSGFVVRGTPAPRLPIDVRTHKLGSHRSITGDQGGPAETWVSVTSHLHSAPTQDLVMSVCIRIRTGRKHQIRTHLKSAGHPSIADGMYTVSDVNMVHLAPFEVGYVHAGCPSKP